MENSSNQASYTFIVKNGDVYQCLSVDGIRNLDAKENYSVEAFIPVQPFKNSYENLEDLLTDIKSLEEVEKDLVLKQLISELEKKTLEVNYKGLEGKEVIVYLPNVVKKAFDHYFNLYEKVGVNSRDIAIIISGLAEVIHREKVGEAYARIVNEGKLPIFDTDRNIKGQLFKLNSEPLRLIDVNGDSMKLREFEIKKFLQHLYSLFNVLGKKYRSSGDQSLKIEEAHRVIYNLISDLF